MSILKKVIVKLYERDVSNRPFLINSEKSYRKELLELIDISEKDKWLKDLIHIYTSQMFPIFNKEKNVIGFYTIAKTRSGDIRLERIFIKKEFRGNGYAEKTLKKIINKYKNLILFIHKNNLNMLKCAESVGLEQLFKKIDDKNHLIYGVKKIHKNKKWYKEYLNFF